MGVCKCAAIWTECGIFVQAPKDGCETVVVQSAESAAPHMLCVLMACQLSSALTCGGR